MTIIKLSDVIKFEETGMTPKEEAKFFQKLVNEKGGVNGNIQNNVIGER